MNQDFEKENQQEEQVDSLSLKEKFLSKKKSRKNILTIKIFFSFISFILLIFCIYSFYFSNFNYISNNNTSNMEINPSQEKSSFYTYIDSTTNNEVTLSYILTRNPNTKKAIILCHGLFTNKNNEVSLPLVEGLIPYWNVIRFDFEGNGESSGEWSFADYPREVRNIIAIKNLAENNFNLEIEAIIGHSKAGADVLILASDPNLIKNKNCCFISMGGRITFGKPERRFTEEELNKAKNEGFFMWKNKGKFWKVTQKALDERKNMNPKIGVKNIDKYRAERILQVHGTNDKTTPIEEAYVIEKEIPGAQIKWIDGADHKFIGKEKEMVSTIVDWLKSKIK